MNIDDIKGGLEVLAGPVVGGIADVGLAALGRSWSNSDWLSKTGALHGLAVADQLNGPRRTVQGLKQAGLNPALANQGQFSPLQMQSAPMGSNPMKLNPIDLSQLKLVNAEAEKTKAEAESIDLDNQNKRDANTTASWNLKRFFGNLRAEAEAAGNMDAAYDYGQLEGQIGSTGALTALHNYFNMADSSVRYLLNRIDYEFTSHVVDEQLKKGYFKDVARQPRTERLKFAKEIEHLNASIKNLDASSKKTDAEIKLTEAEVERVKYLARQLNNSDINSMIAEGKYAQAAAVIATHWIEDAPETVTGAVGVGVKAKVANSIVKKGAEAIKK